MSQERKWGHEWRSASASSCPTAHTHIQTSWSHDVTCVTWPHVSHSSLRAGGRLCCCGYTWTHLSPERPTSCLLGKPDKVTFDPLNTGIRPGLPADSADLQSVMITTDYNNKSRVCGLIFFPFVWMLGIDWQYRDMACWKEPVSFYLLNVSTVFNFQSFLFSSFTLQYWCLKNWYKYIYFVTLLFAKGIFRYLCLS